MSLRLWLQNQLYPPRPPKWPEERELIGAAFRANDEGQMRAHWERLSTQIDRNETRPHEAIKAIYAGRSLSQWLVKNRRFPEAELVLLRVQKRLCPDWRESVKVLFALTDAIWGQNERSRAEREALAPLQTLLDWAPDADFTFRLRAKLAFYRFDFESEAKYLEQSFEVAPSSYSPALTPSDIAWNRLGCAEAWKRAGNETRSREQIERVISDAPTSSLALSAQWRLFFTETQEQNYENARTIIERVVELAGEEPLQKQKAAIMRAFLALQTGELDQCDSLLEMLDAPKGEFAQRWKLNLTFISRDKRGEFDLARALHIEYEALPPQFSPADDHWRGLVALERANFEMSAQAYAGCGDLDTAKSRLKLARTLLRGDQSNEALIEACEIVLTAMQGHQTMALEKAPLLAQIFERWGDSPVMQRELGNHVLNLFEVCGESAQVLRWSKRLLQQWPQDANDHAALLTMAQAYELEGDNIQARALRERVASGNPNLLLVRMARAKLEESGGQDKS